MDKQSETATGADGRQQSPSGHSHSRNMARRGTEDPSHGSRSRRGWGVTENQHKHSTGFETCSNEPIPRVYMRIHPESKSCGHVRYGIECFFSMTLLPTRRGPVENNTRHHEPNPRIHVRIHPEVML